MSSLDCTPASPLQFLTAILLLGAPTSEAATLIVRQDGLGDAVSIQDAIDMAGPLDDVLVFPGTYFEAINFRGKNIRVESHGGPSQTVIDGRHENTSVVSFTSGETSSATLAGFTVTGGRSGTPEITGSSARYGLGVIIIDSSPRIVGNYIFGNRSDVPLTFGGGLAFHSAGGVGAPLIAENVFENNSTFQLGGGLLLLGTSGAVVEGNTIIRNSTARDGGGLWFKGRGRVSNNFFRDNSAGDHGGGLVALGHTFIAGRLEVSWNVITRNVAFGAPTMGQVGAGGGLVVSGSRVDVQNNTIDANLGYGTPRAGGGIVASALEDIHFFRNLVTRNVGGGVLCVNSDEAALGDSNIIWGNESYQVASDCEQDFSETLFSVLDPYFCGDGPELSANSPALVGTLTIGALQEPGCSIVSVALTSWGNLKTRFASKKE